jgi:ATP-dependent protease ClpP protease subunit
LRLDENPWCHAFAMPAGPAEIETRNMGATRAARLADDHPGGCYIGFNAAIDRKAAEQLAVTITDAQKNGFEEVHLCISSIGGLLDHAYYLFSILEALPIGIVTHNVGNIQSAANILFLCGDRRYANEGATFFFHQTGYDPPAGRITEPYLQEKLKAAQYDDTRSAGIIAAKTGLSLESVREWQNSERVMDTHAALSHGIIHGVQRLAIPPNAFFYQVVV